MAAPSPLVLVVGMHRSGTSLLGGVLQRLGLALPGRPIAADQHNPAGYFEWDQVVAIQERLLIDLNRWWPSANGCLPMPDGWMYCRETRLAAEQLRGLLQVEKERHQQLWGLKDPRCSRLLPLWIAMAADLGLPLHLLLAIRDPREVAMSLVRRDGPITGMDRNRAQQLWWRHTVEVLHTSAQASLPLTVIDYGSWFDRPQQQLTRLVHSLPSMQPTEDQRRQALDLIQPDLRRNRVDQRRPRGQQGLNPAVERLYRQLVKTRCRSSDPTVSTRATLPRLDPPRQLIVSAPSGVPEPEQLRADPQAWNGWLEHWRHYPAPRWFGERPLGIQPRISCCGQAWTDVTPHLLWQHVPLMELGERGIDHMASSSHQIHLSVSHSVGGSGLEHLALNLELPQPDRVSHWLHLLMAQDVIWDPDPARVLLLRALGLKAWWLDPEASLNGWLTQPDAVNPTRWATELGLAPVSQGVLLVLGHAGATFDQALAVEANRGLGGDASSDVPIHYQPGWSDLEQATPAAGLAKAGWLQLASQAAARLIVPTASLPSEWTWLGDVANRPLALEPPLSPVEIRAQHAGVPLHAAAEDRELPPTDTLLDRYFGSESEVEQEAAGAVVVSLFNYAGRITTALDSVVAQSQKSLELIVVDDASTDQGVNVVMRWMEVHANRFVRCSLLRHQRNAGLAVARNTAFTAAKASWCFVLDADNVLYPQAVSACLEVAGQMDDSVAVVHPLLLVEAEAGRPDERRSLVGLDSWQQSKFLRGNYIDAMALIRRSVWDKVGGYTHIEGGWEDYDFWCKLVEAGYHGVQCPQVLAVYRSHADSMTMHSTMRLQRPLSRTLQARHPWLELALARP